MFLFFGIVAVAGSYFVQVQHLPWQAFGCAVPVGLLASAILVVNNVRDLETDRRAGKRTLAVRLGGERTRNLYTAMVARPFVSAPLPWALGSMRRGCCSAGRRSGRGGGRADRAHAYRRAVAERRAGENRRDAAAVLPVVLRGHTRERRHRLVKLRVRASLARA